MDRTTRIADGKATYFVTCIHGDCYGYYTTERKAQNAMAQIGKGLVG